ncbi:MAG: hypothetical protein ABIQ31_17280 [Ferruginibacter sp.]
MRYFKRKWTESTGESLTAFWGTSDYYFETDDQLNVTRQLQVFEQGQVLKYGAEFTEDDFGRLADQPLDEAEFKEHEIATGEFKNIWSSLKRAIT